MWSIADTVCLLLAGAAMLCCNSGCASPNNPRPKVSEATLRQYLCDKPASLKPLYRKVLVEGRRNRVLNQMEAGLAAMHEGEYDLAEESFDEALLGIEAVFADSEQAARARSLWYEEGSKIFKGEPYERAMAYYYRGLLYLREGDFENARACFKSGILQDAFAEEDQHRCDFALLIFLEGWASQCLGQRQMAEAAYEEVKKLRPDFEPPEWDDNILVIAETGRAPRKLADGVGHYELKFRRGKDFSEERARVSLGEHSGLAYPMEDIYWQASTRGGRAVQKILEGQVVFRQKQERMGTVLTDVSSAAMISAPLFSDAGDVQGVSAALGLVGVAQMVVASNVRARADTRYWSSLPDAVHVFTAKTNPGDACVNVEFLDRSARPTGLRRSGRGPVYPDGEHGFAWIRSRPAVTTVD